jgi:hypothetical protein
MKKVPSKQKYFFDQAPRQIFPFRGLLLESLLFTEVGSPFAAQLAAEVSAKRV